MTKFQKRLLLFVVAVIFFGFVVLMKDDINKTGKASRLHFPMPPSFEVIVPHFNYVMYNIILTICLYLGAHQRRYRRSKRNYPKKS